MATGKVQLTVTYGTSINKVTKLDVIFNSAARPFIHWNTQPSSQDVLDPDTFPPGGLVTVSMTFPDASTCTMQWTADTFQGITEKLNQDMSSQSMELQFSQRCFLSTSGYTTWRFHFQNTNRENDPGYNVTAGKYFTIGFPDPISLLALGKKTDHAGVNCFHQRPKVRFRNRGLNFLLSDQLIQLMISHPFQSNFHGGMTRAHSCISRLQSLLSAKT